MGQQGVTSRSIEVGFGADGRAYTQSSEPGGEQRSAVAVIERRRMALKKTAPYRGSSVS